MNDTLSSSIRDNSSFYNIEKRILISFITDTAFCREMLPLIDYNLVGNKHVKIIIKWVSNYVNSYGKAPNSEIEGIYFKKKKSLSPEVSAIILSILEHLSDYEDSGNKFDTKHSIDIAKEYFTGEILRLTSEKILNYLEQGNTQEAKILMQTFKGIKDMECGIPDAFTNKELVDKTIEKLWYPEDSPDRVLQLIGRLGEFLGPWEIGWLIAVMAPMKRGKTSFMLTCVLDAVLQRKYTVSISLEMPDKDMNIKAVPAITGMQRNDKGFKIVPIFDCLLNQKGGCGKKGVPRNNESIGIPNSPDDYWEHPKHRVCTKCRGTKDFKPSVWYKKTIDKSSPGGAKSIMNSWSPLFDQYLRTKSWPADTITPRVIEGHLDQLLSSEAFDTEIVVVDYADLLLTDDTSLEYRHRIDSIWKNLKAMAHKRGILVITASQTNRIGMNQMEVDSTHASEDIRKVAIVDAFLALNQTKEEKERGVMRIGYTDARFTGNFSQCYCLQDLSRGQFCLDSEF